MIQTRGDSTLSEDNRLVMKAKRRKIRRVCVGAAQPVVIRHGRRGLRWSTCNAHGEQCCH